MSNGISRGEIAITRITVMIEWKATAMELPESLSVQGLLDRLGLAREGHWVAHNRTMLRWADYDRVRLSEGDTVEIFRIVSGG